MHRKFCTVIIFVLLAGCAGCANSGYAGLGAGALAGTMGYALGMRPQDAAVLGASVGVAAGIANEVYNNNNNNGYRCNNGYYGNRY